MNKNIVLFAMLTLIVLVAPMWAQTSILPPGVNKALIEDNLLASLTTNNSGLQRSSAIMLGKIQSAKAVIPLVTVFHNSPHENVRIAAAWALCKIGDPLGMYAVKMAVKNDQCPKVKAACMSYFENIVQHGKFSAAQPEELTNSNAG